MGPLPVRLWTFARASSRRWHALALRSPKLVAQAVLRLSRSQRPDVERLTLDM